MNAVDSTQNLIAAERMQRALDNDPNDIPALLQLAAMLDIVTRPDPEKKRAVLNKILTLEPANQKARLMLLAMDRAEMGGDSSQATPAVIPTVQSIHAQSDKTRVLRYSILLQLVAYLLVASTLYLCFTALLQGEWAALLVFGAFLLFLVIPLWFVSAVVTVSSSGLRLSRLFGVSQREILWSEVQSFQSNALGQGIKLFNREGKMLEISAQMGGYSAIIEILRQMRPDLFSVTEFAAPDGSGTIPGSKIFEKSALTKYGPLVLLVLASPVLLVTVFTAQCIPAIVIAVILYFLWRFALSAPYALKVEANRLGLQSFSKKRELLPQQIKDISIVSTQTRRGFTRKHLQIDMLDGDSIYLSGFPEGNEILYGFLKNWWVASRAT